MKTHQSNLSIWAMAALISSCSFVACAQATPTRYGGARVSTAAIDSAKIKLLQPLQQTVVKLKKLSATGDPDFDYSFQAKLHTQGMQDFVKQEIQNGKDAALIQMAKTMSQNLDADVDMLDATMRQLKPTRPNQMYTQQQNQNIEAMNLKLQQTGTNDKLTSDYDKNFATLLMDQRQDAIDMATTYLKYGKNEALRTYAQQVIDQSKKQVDMLKTMPK